MDSKVREAITIDDYHQRTKHRTDGYARGPETLDWDSQPDPFRVYAGSSTLPLLLKGRSEVLPYQSLFDGSTIPARPLNRDSLGLLLELSLGLSAWKSFGPDRWSLRVNPSSGNLHPTEAYLLLPPGKEISSGVYHYHVYEHELEQRCSFNDEVIKGSSMLLALSSIHRRESWKYGERAYRYCQLDVGHALAAIRYACGVLGWRVRLLDQISDAQLQQLLGINRDEDYGKKVERESPDLLLQIDTDNHATEFDIDAVIDAANNGSWTGQANRLTDDNFYKWPIIHAAEMAATKPSTESMVESFDKAISPPAVDGALNASILIRQRRSAQAFEGNAPPLNIDAFRRMLACLQPGDYPPLDIWPLAPRVHHLIFVHRVDGLEPGLYALPRSEAGKELLQRELRDEFSWTPVEGLPLYQLLAGNGANAARMLSCHQPIASESAFAVMMLAEYEQTLQQGPWHYRYLHWEAGMLGQVLYLEAEAAGIRGTGIGCFFDDAAHEQLGIKGKILQDIYHFTVGTPRIDNRLQTELPYGHLKDR